MPCENQQNLIAPFPELQPVLAAVKKLHRDNGRYAFHDYLTEVYRVVWHWSRKRIRKRQTKRLAYIAKTDTRRNAHAFRVIIEATSPSAEAKMASRWTRALEFALSERIPISELDKYFRSSGGVAACARRAAFEIPKRGTYRKTWD
jgi:hypothetical protein